jgi:hypothetical protein
MKTIKDQLIKKQKELILKLQSMVDSQQDYDRDYHEIWMEWMEIAVLDKQIEQPEKTAEEILRKNESLFEENPFTEMYIKTKEAILKCMEEYRQVSPYEGKTTLRPESPLNVTDKTAESIEHIFKNVQRIHGNSEALDWIKIASSRVAEYLSHQQPEKTVFISDEEIESFATKMTQDPVRWNYLVDGAKWMRSQSQASLIDELVKFRDALFKSTEIDITNKYIDNYLKQLK